MTDKQIIIDDLMKQLNEKTVAIMLLRETLDRKEQECEGLKEEIKKHNDDMFKNPPEKRFYCEGCTLPYISKKLKKTLTEIKEIAENCKSHNADGCYECKYFDDCEVEGEEIPTRDVCKLILQKVSECEVK
jgi:hypothetical protein